MISENIKRCRDAIGMTQKQVAEKAQLSLSVYQTLERGTREPRVSELSQIAKSLGVPIVKLCPEEFVRLDTVPARPDIDRQSMPDQELSFLASIKNFFGRIWKSVCGQK